MKTVLDYPTPLAGAMANELPQPPSKAGIEMRVLDPMVDAEWDQLVLSHREATFFHSSAWARTLMRTYGHKPFYLSFSRAFAPVALVPMMEVDSAFTGRRGVSLPFSDFCCPLLFQKDDHGFILSELSALTSERAWKHFELRDPRSLELAIEPAIQYFGHSLDLQPGPNALFSDFSSPVQRAIRKAEKSKLKVQVSQDLESIRAFYGLHVLTRRRHGLPPQPFSFFRNLFEEAFRAGLGFVVQATREKRCVAAAIFFRFGRTALYKYGASDLAVHHLRANNLVMWEAIRFLARSACDSLHFGRTSLTDAGLRRFKLGWGAAEEVIRYVRWNTASKQWSAGRDHLQGAHNLLFAKMPLAFNRLAGTLLYPHLD